MAGSVPSGWPDGVRPPGSGSWEASAVAWLLGLVPEYRDVGVVYRFPVLLAFIARHAVHGRVEGARAGYRVLRAELAEMIPPHAADTALLACRMEGLRLAKDERAVVLVERALRGEDVAGLARSLAVMRVMRRWTRQCHEELTRPNRAWAASQATRSGRCRAAGKVFSGAV
jgi:hypothetical protein